MTSDGRVATVTGTRVQEHSEGIAVYNFTVDGDHTYFVTDVADDQAVWVHNQEAPPVPGAHPTNATGGAVKPNVSIPAAAPQKSSIVFVPRNWTPRGLGNILQEEIEARYKMVHPGEVLGDKFLWQIAGEMGRFSIVTGQYGEVRPDLYNKVSTDLYEIKPATQMLRAQAEALWYCNLLHLSGVPARLGKADDAGTWGSAQTSIGQYIWYSPMNGVIVYERVAKPPGPDNPAQVANDGIVSDTPVVIGGAAAIALKSMAGGAGSSTGAAGGGSSVIGYIGRATLEALDKAAGFIFIMPSIFFEAADPNSDFYRNGPPTF